jgi:pimeloyl-ACP methyl ester carboxylesterase
LAELKVAGRWCRREKVDVMATLVSERVGEFWYEGARLEYTEYGSGAEVVVLLHGQLMPRRMHDPLGRRIAGLGYHVYTLDLIGHGTSDRPTDPHWYGMTHFGEQLVAFLDHLGVDQAVLGGTSLGANVSLEVAQAHPERVLGMLIEMPVLDNAVEAGILAFAPLLFFGRVLPWMVSLLAAATRAVPRRLVPFWTGVALDTLDQQPASMAALVHGVFYGRVAPTSRQRRQMTLPALVIGHPHDPIHPAADASALADELPNAAFVAARSVFEWRARPERIDAEVFGFLDQCFRDVRLPSRRNRPRRAAGATMGS